MSVAAIPYTSSHLKNRETVKILSFFLSLLFAFAGNQKTSRKGEKLQRKTLNIFEIASNTSTALMPINDNCFTVYGKLSERH